MFEAVGKRVLHLRRTAIGGLTLRDGMEPGDYAELSREEAYQAAAQGGMPPLR